MDLEYELTKGNKVYFYKQDQDSSIMMVVVEKGGVYKQLPCTFDLEKFPNLLHVLSLNYTLYIKYSKAFDAQLLNKSVEKEVIATFRAAQFYDALTLLDNGIHLYFEKKENEIVRK